MHVSNDMDAAIVDAEVLLVCLVSGERAVCLARPHWFEEEDQSRTLRWQSTWDGSPIPADWIPLAWATMDELETATEDVV